MNARRVCIVATRHEAAPDGIRITRELLERPPVAVVPELDSVIGGWWYRAGGYSVGLRTGTPLG